MSFLPIYILILGFTIIVDYQAGIWIEKSQGRSRKTFLILSLITNIGVLAFFKYFNFLNDNLSAVLNQLGYNNEIPNLSILLPVGLSFHTFQAMSYTIEVYRGHQKAEKHFGIYALYVMFYPQLVAGPIERPQNILPQFRKHHKFDYVNVTSGLKLMTWGLFKKVVISDRVALAVNEVYGNPTQFEGLPLILATFLFSIQIYCDFSGYSDIAIGSARVMGFKLMQNFNRPYLSQSISEFWKRWHISLSSWFRDYVYIPLGGNRVRVHRLYFNTLLTFLISGLWHGANWTFIIWGGMNGVYLIIENSLKISLTFFKNRKLKYVVTFTEILVTFLLINLSWIFFRASSVSDATYIIEHLFSNFSTSISVALSPKMGIDKYDSAIIIYSVATLITVEIIQSKYSISNLLVGRPAFIRRIAYVSLLLAILLTGQFDEPQQFIYFQF